MGYKCKYCEKTYAGITKLKAHSLRFHNEYTASDYYKNSYTCKKCGKHYTHRRQFIGHCSTHVRRRKPTNTKAKPRIGKTCIDGYIPTCRFCGGCFESYYKLAGHVPACTQNPKKDENLERNRERGKRQLGKSLSEETRRKISEAMRLAVKEGRQRTPRAWGTALPYKNITGKEFVLQSQWEVRVAEELNRRNVLWVRGTHGYPYIHEGKHRHYFPDFYLCGKRTYIEVKGYVTSLDESKWRDFPINKKLLIIKKKEMANLSIFFDVNLGNIS